MTSFYVLIKIVLILTTKLFSFRQQTCTFKTSLIQITIKYIELLSFHFIFHKNMWRDNFLILLMKRVSTHVSYNSLYLFHICQPFISYTFYFIYLQTNIIFINICFYLNASQHILIIYSHSNYLVTNQFIIFQFTYSVHAPVAEWYMRTPLMHN